MKKYVIAAFAFVATTAIAFSQNIQNPAPVGGTGAYNASPPTCTTGNWCALQTDANGNLLTSGSSGGGGLAPGGAFATLTATNSSASVALPTGTTVVFQNTGTTAVSCTLGIGSATATTNMNIIQPASWVAYTVGLNTFGACIDQTGSASNLVVLSGGTGVPNGSGGGGASGGGGGAITAASSSYAAGAFSAGVAVAGSWLDGALVTMGAIGDAAYTGSGNSTEIAALKGLYAAAIASISCTATTAYNTHTYTNATSNVVPCDLNGNQFVHQVPDATTIAGAPPGRTYNTVAASQTTQALTGGGGGATGDYLSHCVVIPTSVSPGVVTIIDNASTIYAFPGGASSLSNLVPFTIPVGAVSTSGAWKITTGASLSVVCIGKFT